MRTVTRFNWSERLKHLPQMFLCWSGSRSRLSMWAVLGLLRECNHCFDIPHLALGPEAACSEWVLDIEPLLVSTAIAIGSGLLPMEVAIRSVLAPACPAPTLLPAAVGLQLTRPVFHNLCIPPPPWQQPSMQPSVSVAVKCSDSMWSSVY